MRADFHKNNLLNDDKLSQTSAAIRRCVHCGLCTATCPTYILLGDERDSPRGRIYMIKNMLEEARPPEKNEIKHIDRCLVCLGCTSTCPSGVDYNSLINHGKHYIENYRPWYQKSLRRLSIYIFSSGFLSKLLMASAYLASPISKHIPFISNYVDLLPKWDIHPLAGNQSGLFTAQSPQRGRVLLSRGCVQNAIGAQIHDRALQFLIHQGFEVVVPPITCCGSLEFHMGYEAVNAIEKTIMQWQKAEKKYGECDLIINTSSGCTSTMKHYANLTKKHSIYEKAQIYEKKVMDFTEFVEHFPIRGIPVHKLDNLKIAYHAPCSYQHGQKKGNDIPSFLTETGATFVKLNEAHICCGSAGTYNIFQQKIANELRERKQAFVKEMEADLLVTSNIGCMLQLSAGANGLSVCHISELLAFVYLGLPIHSCDYSSSAGSSDGIS